MEDFDILYMMKTPFFMGNYSKVVDESSSVELSYDDMKNQTLKNFLIVRALTAKGDFV